jgi:hypothetical protein
MSRRAFEVLPQRTVLLRSARGKAETYLLVSSHDGPIPHFEALRGNKVGRMIWNRAAAHLRFCHKERHC